MRNPLSRLLAAGPELATLIITAPFLGASAAITPTEVPSPNLDLSQLGRVAVAGDFDSISVYTYQGQNENAFVNNGSQSILMRFPNGALQPVGASDAYIHTMCPFYANNTLQGVVVGGNFTSLGGVQAQGIALWNPETTQVTALPGLSGTVSSVFCDNGIVYVGGMFMGANSSNALAWTTGWTNLPFAGFNGPVKSIAKTSSGKIVFAGQFEGLGNATTPKTPDQQVVNLGSADITTEGSTTRDGLGDPRNIICKTGEQDGPGNTWLLSDNRQGFWQANLKFGFNPTKLRLYNTRYEGRGTKTFYFEELNTGGVLNMNYIDAQGRNQSCSSRCPLPENNATYQDFHFVPPVGMNTFRVFIAEWYGAGGGLAGIEMFQNDMYSFAVNDFNEPQCAGLSTGASSTVSPATGLWQQMPSNGRTNSDYLTVTLTDASRVNENTNVVFRPNIKQSGNYSVLMYTPGCIGDGTCGTRGLVDIKASMTSNGAPVTTSLFQNNYYDKFDQIYYGYIDVDSGSFKPTVTLSPQAGQRTPLTIVAQRVRFDLIASTGGLNGLYEYDPTQAVASTDFSKSAINVAGSNLQQRAHVNQVVQSGDTIFAAGQFSSNGISNIISIKDKAAALPGGGLNAAVQSLWLNGSSLYVGGNFSNTAERNVEGLNNVAMFDISANKWNPLGAGVGGPVSSLVPVVFNVTSGRSEECITVNGAFTSVNAFSGKAAFNADGFAVWVPSMSDWLHNIQNGRDQVSGRLSTYTALSEGDPMSMIYAGDLMADNAEMSGAVALVGSGRPSISSLGIRLTSNTQASNNSGSLQKRAIDPSQNYSGVYTGLFYKDNGLNITILGGHFATQASDGSAIENLVLINNTDSNRQTVTGLKGLNSVSTFAAMDTQSTLLFAGGSVSGNVDSRDINGLVVYDLVAARLADTQPPALSGNGATVNTIATRPGSNIVYVGGNFSSAGSLPCASLCFFDTNVHQWNSPGPGLTGTINKMTWSSNDQLIIAGNLTVSGNATGMATYDAKTQTYKQYTSSSLPGPVSAFSVADSSYSQFWAAGTATANGTTFLSKYDGSNWVGVGGFGDGTIIRGLQVMSVTSSHSGTALVPSDLVLLLTGNINIPGFGNSSAALFNGTTYQPFILTHRQDGSQGSISNIFVGNPQNFMNASGGHLALGLVVLIGLAISLGIIFLMVVAGILIERYRRRREGYVPMSMDKNGNLERIPPETLLGDLGKESNTPRI